MSRVFSKPMIWEVMSRFGLRCSKLITLVVIRDINYRCSISSYFFRYELTSLITCGRIWLVSFAYLTSSLSSRKYLDSSSCLDLLYPGHSGD